MEMYVLEYWVCVDDKLIIKPKMNECNANIRKLCQMSKIINVKIMNNT